MEISDVHCCHSLLRCYGVHTRSARAGTAYRADSVTLRRPCRVRGGNRTYYGSDRDGA